MLLVEQNTQPAIHVYFGIAGLTLTSKLKKQGGTLQTVVPTYIDLGDGAYAVVPLTAHNDTFGENLWLITDGVVTLPRVYQVVAFNPNLVAVGAATSQLQETIFDIVEELDTNLLMARLDDIPTNEEFTTRIPGVVETKTQADTRQTEVLEAIENKETVVNAQEIRNALSTFWVDTRRPHVVYQWQIGPDDSIHDPPNFLSNPE